MSTRMALELQLSAIDRPSDKRKAISLKRGEFQDRTCEKRTFEDRDSLALEVTYVQP